MAIKGIGAAHFAWDEQLQIVITMLGRAQFNLTCSVRDGVSSVMPMALLSSTFSN